MFYFVFMFFDNIIFTILYYALFLIFIVSIIFLVIREINLWYWRINERIELLEKMAKSLEFLENEIKNSKNKSI